MLHLFRFLRPYRAQIAVMLVLLSAQAMSELYLARLMADIVDLGIVRGDGAAIWRVGGLMLLITAAGAACGVIASLLSARVASGFGRDLRRRVFAHVESFSLLEFDRFGTATLITRTTNDITQLQQVTVMAARIAVVAPVMSIGGVIMAVRMDATLSLTLVVALPVLAGLIGGIAYFSVPLFRTLQEQIDRLNLVVRERLTGIRVIRAFNRTAHEVQRFAAANRDLTETATSVNILMGATMPLMMLVLNLTAILVVWFGGLRIAAGNLQVGGLMAFVQYVMQIMFSVVMISFILALLPRAAASANRVLAVLATQPQIRDPERPRVAGAGRGQVEFQSVTFRYPGAEEPAVRDVSFQAGPGEVTAIIGGTGAGKSTLVSLLLRFYDVDSGAVLVDGVDVRDWPLAELRARIGYVPQQALLFSGSVAENIRYGKPGATPAEVRHAAAVAQAAEFIAQMAGEYDAEVAQGGANLSGGQKQRLTIARALVRRPEIYVFDDNFSALDFKTDARLRSRLRAETAGATVLVVAQRVSTVLDADQIVVLDEGAVVGVGTHQELLQSCQVYREIVASQLGEEQIA